MANRNTLDRHARQSLRSVHSREEMVPYRETEEGKAARERDREEIANRQSALRAFAVKDRVITPRGPGTVTEVLPNRGSMYVKLDSTGKPESFSPLFVDPAPKKK